MATRRSARFSAATANGGGKGSSEVEDRRLENGGEAHTDTGPGEAVGAEAPRPVMEAPSPSRGVADPERVASHSGAEAPQPDASVLVHSEDLSDIASVYCLLRTFSWQLRLSPFSLKALVCGLASKRHCQLVDEVHVSLMRLLLLDMVPEDRANFGINVAFLDYQTWPEFVWQYLEFKHEQKLQKKRNENGVDKIAKLHGNEPENEPDDPNPEVNDPLTRYRYGLEEKGPSRDRLATYKRESASREGDLGIKLSLCEADAGEVGDTCLVKVVLDWGREQHERVERVRSAVIEPAAGRGAVGRRGQHDLVRRSKEYHLVDLRGKVSILQRLCDDILDCSVVRCEMWQREEYGMRQVLRFNTLLHTLNSKQEFGGPGRKSLSKQFKPSAKDLLQTPKKRGRPPKWAVQLAQTPASGKKEKTGDEDWDPRSEARRGPRVSFTSPSGEASSAAAEGLGANDHNYDACVLCGLGGNLLCCDGCPAAFHVKCGGENNKIIMSDGQWLCEECRIKKENDGKYSDSLHEDLMCLKKVTCAPKTGMRTATWQIQDFAFQCSVLDTEVEVEEPKKPRSSRKGKKKSRPQQPMVYAGSSAPISIEWKCKGLATRHPLETKQEAAEALKGGFEEEIRVEYFDHEIDAYVNKYKHSWQTLFNEMSSRTKTRGADKVLTISKYQWPTRIARGQKNLGKLPLCNVHPNAHVAVVYLSRTERRLWGLLEGNWGAQAAWRSKWINSVFHASTPHELGLRLIELEEALDERARTDRWFQTADFRLLSNRMREDPQQEIRSVQKYIGLKLGELKLGEYVDRPQALQAVHPVRPGKRKPWPYRLYATGEKPLFTWRKNRNFLGNSKSLARKQARQTARRGGVHPVVGCLYPNKRYGVLSQQQEWRLRAEEAETFSEIAVLIREFNDSIVWDEVTDVPEDCAGMEVLDRRECEEISEEDGEVYSVVEYWCRRPPVETSEFGEQSSYQAPEAGVVKEEWVREEDVPLKLVKDYVEIQRMESSKSERYFLRAEHVHPGLTGMNVETFWADEARWYKASLVVLPKDRGVKLVYASGHEEAMDMASFNEALQNQEISVERDVLKGQLSRAKYLEQQKEFEAKAAKEAEEELKRQRKLEREKERQSQRIELTEDDHKRLKLVNKAILDACVRISTGKDTTKGKKSKEWVASFIPRNVLNVLLDRAESGHLKPICMEVAGGDSEEQVRKVPVVGVVPSDGEDRNGKKLSAEHFEPPAVQPSSQARMNRENQDRCLLILERMMDVKGEGEDEGVELASEFYLLPTRKVIPDYYKAIAAPIDIYSIRACLNRTKTNTYGNVQDFVRDVELMFSNARTYNQEDSKIYEYAVKLREWFWGQVGDYFPFVTQENWAENTSDKVSARTAAEKAAAKAKAKEEKQKLKELAKIQAKEAREALKREKQEAKAKAQAEARAAKQAAQLQKPRGLQRPLRERLLAALSVVRDVMKLPESYPFHDPVDVELIPVYGEIIKSPMDLGTIKDRLEAGKEVGWSKIEYRSEAEVLRDAKLVWSNCRTFNNEEDPVYKQSQVVEPAFDTLWKLRVEISDGRRYHIDSNKPKVLTEAPEKCVGYRVGVWWPRSLCFFYGNIVSYEKEKHKIEYDDGQTAYVTLSKHHVHYYDDRFDFAYTFSASDGNPVDLAKIEEEAARAREAAKAKVKRPVLTEPKSKETAVGWRLGLLWEEDNTYYYGLVKSYDAAEGKHTILYDDGSVESIDLSGVTVKWVMQTIPEPEPAPEPKKKKVRTVRCGECASCLNPRAKKGCLNPRPKIKPAEKQAEPEPPMGEAAVGWRVGVYWDPDKKYYYGVIHSFDAAAGTHAVFYEEDGTMENLDLSKVKIEWVKQTRPELVPKAKLSGKKRASASSGSSKPAAKKAKTSAKPPTGSNAVGSRVGVWWEDDKTFYYGTIKSFDKKEGKHQILYEDGTDELISLAEEKLDWPGLAQAKAKAVPVSPKPKKKAQPQPPKGEAAVGWRVGVYWGPDKKYYYGVVHSYDKAAGTHLVVYEDSTMESLNLVKVKVQWVEVVPVASRPILIEAPAEEPPAKKAKAPKAKAPKAKAGKGHVGKRVGIWWEDDACFYYGVLESYDESKGTHHIKYDDGTDEHLHLGEHKVDWKGKAK